MKMVELKGVENLLKLIERRDSFNDWSDAFKKYDREVKIEIECIKKSAVDVEMKYSTEFK